MKTQNARTVITATALMLGMTGCIGSPIGESGSSSSPRTSAEESTVEPTVTPSTDTTPREADPVRIRNGIYLDTWGENVATHFQSAAYVYLHDNRGRVKPGDLQKYLDKIISADTPDVFQVKASTTASNNFTIKVWHVNGYLHFDENTAYTAQTDPAVIPTPTPSATEFGSNHSQRLDEETKRILYQAAVAAEKYRRENQEMLPSDQVMRITGVIPNDWEWSISTNDFHAEYFLIRVWNPDAFLFNAKEAAATFSSFPQPEMRPAYNFDVDPFMPNIGFLSPRATVPAPTSAQSAAAAS